MIIPFVLHITNIGILLLQFVLYIIFILYIKVKYFIFTCIVYDIQE